MAIEVHIFLTAKKKSVGIENPFTCDVLHYQPVFLYNYWCETFTPIILWLWLIEDSEDWLRVVQDTGFS